MIRFLNKNTVFDDCDISSFQHVILNNDIWKNIQDIVVNYGFGIISIVNEAGELVCYAYHDMDANREIRMLNELMEHPEAIQFSDIFSEYQYVKIYGFNELAYCFAKYLVSQNIHVCVYGELWEFYWEKEEFKTTDHDTMIIYAEGTWFPKRSWKENLLRSVSVEFECIDKIYETNIKKGILKNAIGNVDDLIEKLKKEEELIIIGSDTLAQNAYDFLRSRGLDICSFMNNNTDECSHKMFGKQILSDLDIRRYYKKAVFLECTMKNSAWNGTDDYAYMGYQRNKRFFLLRDYVEPQGNHLINVLRSSKVVLAGDAALCNVLCEYLRKNEINVLGILNIIDVVQAGDALIGIDIEDIDEDIVCLIAISDFWYFQSEPKSDKKGKIKKFIKDNNVNDYTAYFSDMVSFVDIEQKCVHKYPRRYFMPKKIIIGASESCSGNIFFRELLDGHPSVLMISEYDFLNNNLFWICILLSQKAADGILPYFWQILGEECDDIMPAPELFNAKMSQLLSCGNKFTSQELFVMFHIAYEFMYGRNVTDIENMVIFWEPHLFPRSIVEECVRWLQADLVQCDILTVVRNICSIQGSSIKGRVLMKWKMNMSLYNFFIGLWDYPPTEKRIYKDCRRLVIKFEELKCSPTEVLPEICNKMGIMWSDTLLRTTRHGKPSSYNNGHFMINDFDLRPVYDLYEEYFSEFDRFRIMLMDAPWQIKYGYTYVKLTDFSYKELQEIFLKEFRFEKFLQFNGENAKLNYRIALQKMLKNKLQKVKMLECMMSESDLEGKEKV